MGLLKQAECEHHNHVTQLANEIKQHRASLKATQQPPTFTSPPPPVTAVGEGVANEARDEEEVSTEQHRGVVKEGATRGGGEKVKEGGEDQAGERRYERFIGDWRIDERSTGEWAGGRGGERSACEWVGERGGTGGGRRGERSAGGWVGGRRGTGEQTGGRRGERAGLTESWMAGVGGETDGSEAMDILELENTATKVSVKKNSIELMLSLRARSMVMAQSLLSRT